MEAKGGSIMAIARHVAVLPSGIRPFFEWTGPATHVLLRVAAALLFMQHGVQKLFGWLGGMGGSGATAPLASLAGVAGILELFGGILLLVGLLTRPVALLLAGEMVVAYVIAHMPQGGFPVQNQGELALLFAAIFAFLFGNGAGVWSLDHWLGVRRAQREAHGQVSPAESERRSPEEASRSARHTAA
jgi:putative oxidoreductase